MSLEYRRGDLFSAQGATLVIPANRNSEGKHLLGKESEEDEMCNS